MHDKNRYGTIEAKIYRNKIKKLGFFLLCVLAASILGFSQTISAENINDRSIIKPNIYIIATGGTIAGSGISETSSVYQAGRISIDALIDAVPVLKDIANIEGQQLVNIGSQDMSEDIWLTLAKRVNELVSDPKIDGIVITHGTDTMEETAYFLSLVSKHGKSIVLTGAMRPSTHISADGPLNLYNAVEVAAFPQSKKYGVVVVMNDRIFGAKNVTKTHTRAVDTFQAPDNGPIGFISGRNVKYTSSPIQPTDNDTQRFNIDNVKSLPKVGIIYGYAGIDTAAIQGFIENGYKGLVYAGVGNGNIHKNVLNYLSDLTKKGITVVRASRVTGGGVLSHGEVDDQKYGFIPAGNLSPQKARILLMLSMATGKRYTE